MKEAFAQEGSQSRSVSPPHGRICLWQMRVPKKDVLMHVFFEKDYVNGTKP